MSVLKSTVGVIGLRCDTAGCPRRLNITKTRAPRTAFGVRTYATTMGWSADTAHHTPVGNPRIADYCPICVPQRAAGESCTLCPGGALFDLLGHAHLGHRAARSLLRAGHDTPAEARTLTWLQINDLYQVGLVQARHIWTALHPGEDVPGLPHTHPNVCGHGRKESPQWQRA